ncbi:MAG: acetyl-CoA acetyltransferase [Chloroflexi bacterium]|nr:acetyl-CoA acetyltransferase [Chloroflexota bacterium]
MAATRIATVPTNTAKDQAAVSGVGYTKITRNSGVSVMTLALEACYNAIRDAGLTPKDVDGILSYSVNDSVPVREVAMALGMAGTHWQNDVQGGGSQSCAIVAQAAMAIASGLCKHVVCFRAMNGRSGVRMGRLRTSAGATGFGGTTQFMAPFGFGGPPMTYAMMARRHMIEYGTTNDQLGAIAVTLRANALHNERAVMRDPLTLDDYRASRWVAQPFHLLDCCQETDAACAMIVSRADIARDMPHRPAYVTSFAYGGGPNPGPQLDKYDDFTTMFPKYIAPGLFARAGITVADVDVAEIYDAFTFTVLCQVEDFGFCKKGEGGPFVESGNIALTGKIPVGTHGGLLNEGYVHGLNNVAEAVGQLRGRAGRRQVKDAEIALCSGFGGNVGSALLLRR